MSRYNSYDSSTSTSSSSSNDYEDKTLKLQKFSTLRVTGGRVNTADTQWGDKFIVGFENVAVIDGVVLARDDKPDTWKVFGFNKFKNVGVDEDGVPVDDNGDELSAQEILDSPYVQGFSETFGGDDYYYEPVGVAIEQASDVATNDATTDDGAIEVGEASMLLSNKSWVRKLAKLVTASGDDYIRTEMNDNGNEVAVSDSREWFSSHDPTLRDGLEDREMELFVIEDSFTPNDQDEPITYEVPVLLDAATGERITVDNDASGEPDEDGDEAEAEAEAVAADGGATTESTSTESDTAEPETTDDANDGGGTTGNVPEVLDDLIDYFARTDGEDTTEDDLREMAGDEVDADNVDWDAAVAEVYSRA
jgi:hypothetical protein